MTDRDSGGIGTLYVHDPHNDAHGPIAAATNADPLFVELEAPERRYVLKTRTHSKPQQKKT